MRSSSCSCPSTYLVTGGNGSSTTRTPAGSGRSCSAGPTSSSPRSRSGATSEGGPLRLERTATRAVPRRHRPATSLGAWASYPCIVTVMRARDLDPEAAAEQLERLRFLHHVARRATTARTWDELLDAVVDGTRDALRASVSSLYLLDRDEQGLTLAATNGLDRYQIGRAHIPMGEGVTGRVAATRTPMVIPDVPADPRFLWV